MNDTLNTLWGAVEPALWEGVAALVGIAVALVSIKVRTHLGLQIEAQHRAALEAAIISGIRAATDDDPSTRPLDAALAYVRDSVPDAVATLKPSEAVLRAKIQGALKNGLP